MALPSSPHPSPPESAQGGLDSGRQLGRRQGLSPRRRLSAEHYDDIKERAHELFMLGVPYREIAERVGLSDSGYVQIARWAKKLGWIAEREERDTATKLSRRTTYLTRVSMIQDAHLRLAEKVRHIAELALDGYCVKDEQGNITAIKVNPRTGLPAITPFALQQMIVGSAELERKALGFDLLPPGDMEAASTTTVVDATPIHDSDTLRRIGDFLARQTLETALETTLEATAEPSVETVEEGTEPVRHAVAEDEARPE